MFTTEQRNHVRNYVLKMAQNDPRVTGGALIGSRSHDAEDAWSDIDVTFGIATGHSVEKVINDWTQIIEREFSVLNTFDIVSHTSIYRVFLLPDGLEIDLSVTPEEDFGPHSTHFQLLFGSAQPLKTMPPPDAQYIMNLCWHYIFHARSSIERHKPWQAQYWIGEVRHQTFTLLSLRLGVNASYAKGIDKLPAEGTHPFVDTLVRSLDESELRRALAVTTLCLINEMEEWDVAFCARLKPLLLEFGAPHAEA